MSDEPKVENDNERFWRRDNPLAYGAAITALVLAAYVFLGFQKECIATVCETNFQKFWGADPNEMGDTLAGLFGALAFIWVIVTVLLQGQELREQRKEFREQRIATQDMARAMAAQAAVFEDEMRYRKEREAKEVFENLQERLQRVLDYYSHLPLIWKFTQENEEGKINSLRCRINTSDYDGPQRIRNFTRSMLGVWRTLTEDRGSRTFDAKPVATFADKELSAVLIRFEDTYWELSEADRIVAEDLGLNNAASIWLELVEEPELWVGET